jgi:hypothetical protein
MSILDASGAQSSRMVRRQREPDKFGRMTDAPCFFRRRLCEDRTGFGRRPKRRRGQQAGCQISCGTNRGFDTALAPTNRASVMTQSIVDLVDNWSSVRRMIAPESSTMWPSGDHGSCRIAFFIDPVFADF